MQVPAGYLEREGDGITGVVRADLEAVPLAEFFAIGEPLAQARGRGAGVMVLRLPSGLRAVARIYRRGGALGGVLRELFLDPLRPRRELEVLLALRSVGVAVVEPLAALAQRDGVLWRLRLVTTLVEDALPLPAFVATWPTHRRAVVERAGRVVGAAFAAGLRHRDLHPDNLIATVPREGVAEPSVYLLDLDRARRSPPVSRQTRVLMLARMARYLVRHRARLPAVASRTDRLRFLRGMGFVRRDRHTVARAIDTRLRRQLALRRWFGR